jgi:hypothetical protein
MALDMIKPFKVIETRAEADGSTGVIYEVSKVTSISSSRTKTDRLQAYMTIPEGADVDAYLFEQLSKAGWF